MWISISRTIRCEWKLGLNHVHFWKYTTVLLSSHAIQFLVIVLLCIWIWHSIIVPITTVSLTHLSFPTKGFALDQQCASPDPTIKWVKVMKISTSMRKAIHYRCWMLIERICTNTDITAIAIDPPYPVIKLRPLLLNTTIIIYMFHWFWNNLSSMTVLSELTKYLYLNIARPLLILTSRFKARPVQPLAFLSIWSMID